MRLSLTCTIATVMPNEELAKVGPLAVAVPGEIAGIDAALKRFGTMKFQQVAAPAIKLARDGFPVSEHLAGEIKSSVSMLAMDPGLKEVFLKEDGTAPAAGDKIYEKKLAETIERLGNTPVAKFYDGLDRQRTGFLSPATTAASLPMTIWRIISLFGETRCIAPTTGWWCMRCRRRRPAAWCLKCSGCWSRAICPASASIRRRISRA